MLRGGSTNTTLVRRAWALATVYLPRGAVFLSLLTFGSYLMGLVRDRMFARTFGAGSDLDAYNAAFVLPELALDVLVAGGLVAPFVPIFTGLKGEAAEAARAFGRTILTLSVVVMAIAAAVLFIFAEQSLSFIAPGFSGAQRELYVGLFRIMCVTPVIFAISIVLGEVLIAEQRFVTYGLAPILYNGGIVAGTVLLASRLGIYAAAIGAVAGAALHLAIRVVGIWPTSFRPRPSLRLRTNGVGEFLRLMVPKMASHPIEPLTFLYFTSVASTLGAGSVSSVSFARNFQSVPVSLIGASFAIAAFPALSAAAAAGDRRGFTRLFRTNLATIVVLTTAAAIALVVVAELAIRVLLGGGAFDEEDVARTSGILAVFAISVPLESLTHLLSRALYATKNTFLPAIASIAGFVAIVVAAGGLAPRIGLAAIPAAFAIGMGLKVAILAIALAPRMARIGEPPRPGGWLRQPRPRRVAAVLASMVVVVAGLAATVQTLSGAQLTAWPSVTPWAREHSPAATPLSLAPTPTATAIGSPTATPSPSPTPGPFAMDLYQKGDYAREFRDTWCLPAAMQTSMNIMDEGADVTEATQLRLWNYARSLVPDREGGAEPEAWALGLTKLGYGGYKVSIQRTLKAAIQLAAKQVRLRNRPAGLLVWKGVHAWVMSGFTATRDPAETDNFTVTAVRIEDVWYPRISSIWGKSNPPDTLVPVRKLPEDFVPWHLLYDGPHPDKDGKFVIVIPVGA
ncbi:MAG: murein biosynthesis integral membrane protein MurJ [Chloroflexota bacterium]|nr:murein biosynthesis integral membrane protein MurJ [Chloroflexota bacterium]